MAQNLGFTFRQRLCGSVTPKILYVLYFAFAYHFDFFASFCESMVFHNNYFVFVFFRLCCKVSSPCAPGNTIVCSIRLAFLESNPIKLYIITTRIISQSSTEDAIIKSLFTIVIDFWRLAKSNCKLWFILNFIRSVVEGESFACMLNVIDHKSWER